MLLLLGAKYGNIACVDDLCSWCVKRLFFCSGCERNAETSCLMMLSVVEGGGNLETLSVMRLHFEEGGEMLDRHVKRGFLQRRWYFLFD